MIMAGLLKTPTLSVCVGMQRQMHRLVLNMQMKCDSARTYYKKKMVIKNWPWYRV